VETILLKCGLSIARAAAIAPRETPEKIQPRCGMKWRTIALAAIATPRFLEIIST
jgi:hypothetical protein